VGLVIESYISFLPTWRPAILTVSEACSAKKQPLDHLTTHW
jgi:hypothetical protein